MKERSPLQIGEGSGVRLDFFYFYSRVKTTSCGLPLKENLIIKTKKI